jgi:hypothetical protein
MLDLQVAITLGNEDTTSIPYYGQQMRAEPIAVGGVPRC